MTATEPAISVVPANEASWEDLQLVFGTRGQASDIAIQAEQMLYTKRMFQERVAFHTGQNPDQIEADSDRDRWFTAEEAKDYGFIDKVITGAMQVPEGAGTRS